MNLNDLPVSHKALKMLGETGINHDENCLHFILLANWALQSGTIDAQEDVCETVKAMAGWRTERIANFLMLRQEDDEYDPPGWEDASSAVELAASIINDIEQKMVIHFPWYRSFES